MPSSSVPPRPRARLAHRLSARLTIVAAYAVVVCSAVGFLLDDWGPRHF